MKIYLFNSTERWDTDTARAVVAESPDDAIRLSGITWDEYEVEEFEIYEGMVIIPSGYDNVSIYIGEEYGDNS